MLQIYDFSVNAVKSPAFVPTSGLYVGWKLASDRRDVRQASYCLTLAAGGRTVLDTGTVRSDRSVHIPLDITLESRTDYTLTLTVTAEDGDAATLCHEMATALAPADWLGRWIKPARHIEGWAPYLRTKFACPGSIRRARLYVSGLGCGEYYINGQRVTEDLVDPPIANYEKTVFYRVYDVTDLIGEKNALVALLGEGWYSQSRVWGNHGMKYGDVCLMAQLELEHEDGCTVIATNTEDWSYCYSPITLNNLYGGETYDCRLEIPDFADPEGSEAGWGPVVEDRTPRGELTLCLMPPVRVVRSLPAVAVRNASGRSDGAWIVDFGENVAGIVELKIRNSPRGAQYVLRFAETINPDGTLDHRSIGASATQCIQQDVYIARGDPGGETWRPRFTYHGFRYMEITGYHDLRAYGTDPELCIGTCLVLSTDLRKAGHFESDCEDLDHLQRVMMSTFRSNYHGLPEDCPAREKCGWLGDAQVVCNTGIMNYDMEASYEKYLRDMRTSDEVYGVWQMIAPGKRGCGEASPLWGCANVIIPYWMYRYYGNETVVRENWDMMEKWVRHELADGRSNAPETGSDYIITRGLGDWCPPVGNRSDRRIPVPESSTAMLYEIALRMDELARELCLPAERDYAALAAAVKAAFISHFWLPECHRYSTWGTSGVALALGLYPDGEEAALTQALVDLMAADDFAMPTGIYGNKYLVPALAERGLGDLAMKFLFTRDHVSFGTMLDDGATSLWECLELKGIGQPRERDTASYNHPMHSGFAYFLYAHVAGIRPLEAGFKSFEVSPARFSVIGRARAVHESPYGEIGVSLEREGSTTRYTVTVPPNTAACLRLGEGEEWVGSGTHIRTVEVPNA